MYTRASASDYDDFQAKGWTTKELLPLMRKHETYQRACNNPELHGSDGPIKVSFGNYTYPIKDDFLRAAESQGIPVTDDLQDLKTAYVTDLILSLTSINMNTTTADTVLNIG
jgi:alcohol oxidase